MTKDQEERILTAARQLVAALNSCDEFVTIEHKVAARALIDRCEMPRWLHKIDVNFRRTLSVGSEQE